MKISIARKKKTALDTLEKQLVNGNKPVKGKKPQAIDKDGNLLFEEAKDGVKKPILVDNIPLNSVDIKRINKEITSLKTKLKIA